MSLLHLVIILIVIGVLLALVNKFGAEWIEPTILRIINIVVIVGVVLWVLFLFVGPVPDVRIPRQ